MLVRVMNWVSRHILLAPFMCLFLLFGSCGSSHKSVKSDTKIIQKDSTRESVNIVHGSSTSLRKESYSEEELNEMIVWFNNHADELPKEMQINKAAFTPDLKLTVESCIMQAKQCLGNYKMAGAFRMLQQIRENLEKAAQ